jgi:6-phosphogluconolactonase
VTGKLSLVQDVPVGGQYPRYFSFDPTGKWVICGHQNSNTVAVFSYDAATGKLTQHGDPLAATSPICLGFLPVK